jgi:hypothetical protein
MGKESFSSSKKTNVTEMLTSSQTINKPYLLKQVKTAFTIGIIVELLIGSKKTHGSNILVRVEIRRREIIIFGLRRNFLRPRWWGCKPKKKEMGKSPLARIYTPGRKSIRNRENS